MWTKVLGIFGAISAFVIMILRGRLKDAKIKEQARDIKVKETTRKANKRATEALVRGMEDEAKKPSNRNHFG